MKYGWRITLTAFAAALLVSGAVLPAIAACGDVDNNAQVNVNDVKALAAVIAAAGDCGPNKPACDVVKDGTIDDSDLANLGAQLVGLKTLFDPCTGPGPAVTCTDGTDPDTGLPVHNVPAGNITANQTWPKSCTIHITGTVFVQTADPVNGPHVVLTLEPGVIVKGLAGGTANPAALIVLPGSKIDAQGTPSKPIIMTSGEPVGSRSIGDWGGLLLNGRSTVNRPNCLNTAEGIPAPYGGCDAADSSGIMTYTRVEFSGIEFTPNNELNVITLNGVGNGTVINHIQANAGGDDAIEWFGGTVNVKYFVSTGEADDGFDYQLGTTGARQYGLNVQYGPVLQTGNQSRGIEADNSEFGADDLPRSAPHFCNITNIGARDNDPNLGSQGGYFFRRGTAGGVANAICTNFRDGCIRLDDSATSPWACTNPTTLKPDDPKLLVQSTLCFDNGGTGAFGTATRACAGITQGDPHCSASEWYRMLNATQNVTPANGHCSVTAAQACCQNSDCPSGETCVGVTAGTNPNLGPGWGTHATRWDDVLASGGGYPANVPDVRPTSTVGFPPATDCHQIDDFFDTTNYIGAFDPSGTNWLDTPIVPPHSGNPAEPLSFRRWISFDVN